MHELYWSSATDQARLVKQRQITPTELVQMYLERIERYNPVLRAYVTITGEQALEAAKSAERVLARGGKGPAFCGVPISIKDLNSSAGVRTTYSSRAFADNVPIHDEAVVRRIKKAGFIILGKTNTPEFGNLGVTESELNGICRNPWNLDLTPGGSSGGAAAAVAAGLCPVAQGSDGGGSIRIPASFCGLVGLKPARGRVSLAPKWGDFMSGSSTDGPLGRTVEDVAALLDVMAGYEVGDPYWAPPRRRPFQSELHEPAKPLRIAFTDLNPFGHEFDSECVQAVRKTVSLLEDLGHHVDEAAPSVDASMPSILTRIWQTVLCYYQVTDLSQVEPYNRMLAQRALQTSSADYVEAVNALHAASREVVRFWTRYDVFITSTLVRPRVRAGWVLEPGLDPIEQLKRDGEFLPFYTPLANVTGLPAMSLPLAWTDDGVPIGVHLVGAPADEATLLQLSTQLEAACPWSDRRPKGY